MQSSHGYTDFPKDGVAVVAKLKSTKDNSTGTDIDTTSI